MQNVARISTFCPWIEKNVHHSRTHFSMCERLQRETYYREKTAGHTLIKPSKQLCYNTKNVKSLQQKLFSSQLQSILFVLHTDSFTIQAKSFASFVRSLRTNLFVIKTRCLVICEEVLRNAMPSNASQIAKYFLART